MGTLLSLDASDQEITLKKSKTLHPDAELSLIATKTIGKGEVVGDYYGSPVYSNLARER